MTARAAERVPTARSRVVVAALTGVLVGAAPGLVLGAAPAAAGWRASVTASSGTLDRAKVGAAFDVRTAGGIQRQDSPLAAGALLSGGSVLIDVTSTSTVPVRTNLVLTLSGLGLGQTTVQSCDEAWNATAMTCPAAKTRTVATLGGVGGALSSSWSVELPVGEAQHLKVNGGLSVGATATLTATATPTRSPADRTLG